MGGGRTSLDSTHPDHISTPASSIACLCDLHTSDESPDLCYVLERLAWATVRFVYEIFELLVMRLENGLPAVRSLRNRGVGTGNNDWRYEAKPEDYVVESWSQGFMVGALLIMACITVANMRRGVLLHKLILAEVGKSHSDPTG